MENMPHNRQKSKKASIPPHFSAGTILSDFKKGLKGVLHNIFSVLSELADTYRGELLKNA
jgi:hypothetical protein